MVLLGYNSLSLMPTLISVSRYGMLMVLPPSMRVLVNLHAYKGAATIASTTSAYLPGFGITLGWSSGPHAMMLFDQLIHCGAAGMVALNACSRALRLPLSSDLLVKIMYASSCIGNCCRA